MLGLPPQERFKNLTKLGVVTTPFGGKTANEDFHPAVDVANVKGTPITSPVDGRVISAVDGKIQGDDGYGNNIMIQALNGDKLRFSHLDEIKVGIGQTVKKGQQIATMGNSGNSSSPSGEGDGTHIDIRIVDKYNKYKNPFTYLKNM